MNKRINFLTYQDSEWAEVLQEAVNSLGKLESFYTSASILENLETQIPDLIIIDVIASRNIPELISDIKRIDESIPVLVAYSYQHYDSTLNYLKAGAKNLYKTLNTQKLIQKIQHMLDPK
jgi:DNA-binding NtrC family response regulator